MSPFPRSRALLLLIPLSFLSGCSDKEKPIQPAPEAVVPLEESQSLAIGMSARNEAEAWTRRDTAEVAENIRIEELARRAFWVEGVLPSEATRLRDEFVRQWNAKPGEGLLLPKDGKVRFLNQRERGGHPSALLRVARPNGLFGYVELLYSNTGLGERKIVDVYFYDKGLHLSELIRLWHLPAAGDTADALLRATLGPEATPALAPLVREMAEAQRAGKWAKVAELSARLPPHLAAKPWVALATAWAALNQPGPALPNAIVGKACASLGDVMEADLLKLELGGSPLQLGQLAQTAAILSLRAGGDGQAEAIRATYHAEAGQWPEAEAALDLGWRAEPDLLFLYETALALTIREKQFGKSCVWLDRLEKGLKVTVDPQLLRKIPGFNDLFRSPEFSEWMLKNNRR